MKRTRVEQLREARERNPIYYAKHPHPAYNQFGSPDFVDEFGREYRIAFDLPTQRQASISTALVSLRAARAEDGELENPHADVDDLLLYYLAKATDSTKTLTLKATRPLDTRVRLWVRLPRSKYLDKTPRESLHGRRTVREQAHRWPDPDTPVTLTFVGDENVVPRKEGEMVQQTVQVMRAIRSGRDRATGYVDVTDLPGEICDRILNRKLALMK